MSRDETCFLVPGGGLVEGRSWEDLMYRETMVSKSPVKQTSLRYSHRCKFPHRTTGTHSYGGIRCRTTPLEERSSGAVGSIYTFSVRLNQGGSIMKVTWEVSHNYEVVPIDFLTSDDPPNGLRSSERGEQQSGIIGPTRGWGGRIPGRCSEGQKFLNCSTASRLLYYVPLT